MIRNISDEAMGRWENEHRSMACDDEPTIEDVRYFITLDIRLLILLPLRFGWLLVLGLCKEDYLQIFKCVFFRLHKFCG